MTTTPNHYCPPACPGQGHREYTCARHLTRPGGLRYLRMITVDGQTRALRCRACLKTKEEA